MTDRKTWPVKIELVATVRGNHEPNVIGEFTVDAVAHVEMGEGTSATATLDMDAFAASLADGLVSAAAGIRNGALTEGGTS